MGIYTISFRADSRSFRAFRSCRYVFTNEAHSGHYYDSQYVTTIDDIEVRAGFNFFAAGVLHVRKSLSRIYISDGEEQEYSLSIGSPKTATSVRDYFLRTLQRVYEN